jgi:pyruvate,orthophosphate dikinase
MTDAFQQQPLVYSFGQGRADGTSAMKDLLGGKGAGLAEMTNLGIPVPPGFTIASTLCQTWIDTHSFPTRLRREVEQALQRLEAATGKEFGGEDHPLLVSVRSGAAVSMPGMMDTILNLGLNDHTVEALSRRSGNAPFAWDCYRRFVQMYSTVVLDLPRAPFEAVLDEALHAHGVLRAIDLDGTAVGRNCRGVRFVEHPACHRLSTPARYTRYPGHRRHHRFDGLWQPR